jgi:hypothetical protein
MAGGDEFWHGPQSIGVKGAHTMTTHAIHVTDEMLNHRITSSSSGTRLRAGRILSAVPALFFLVDGGMKLLKPPVVIESTIQLGYPESAIVGLGVVLLVCTALYVIRRTAIVGAVLLTGYLGGAVATHVRMSGPWFTILFPVFLGAIAWVGLYLRDVRLRVLVATNTASR